jgi:hypothetical protein
MIQNDLALKTKQNRPHFVEANGIPIPKPLYKAVICQVV